MKKRRKHEQAKRKLSQPAVHFEYAQVKPWFHLYFAEEGGALLGHLRCVLVELQRLGELVHQHVGLIRMVLCEILHLALQEHQAAMPCIQLIPHVLENVQWKVSSDNANPGLSSTLWKQQQQQFFRLIWSSCV